MPCWSSWVYYWVASAKKVGQNHDWSWVAVPTTGHVALAWLSSLPTGAKYSSTFWISVHFEPNTTTSLCLKHTARSLEHFQLKKIMQHLQTKSSIAPNAKTKRRFLVSMVIEAVNETLRKCDMKKLSPNLSRLESTQRLEFPIGN